MHNPEQLDLNKKKKKKSLSGRPIVGSQEFEIGKSQIRIRKQILVGTSDLI
jgi:hypothetical protein